MSRDELKLLWQLFLRLRALEPATADNTKWANEWAAAFHELDYPSQPGAPAASANHDEATVIVAESDDDDDDSPPVRRAPKRKR